MKYRYIIHVYLNAVMVIFCTNLFAQTQMGSNITPYGNSEEFGRGISMSADGNRIVVGAPASNVGPSNDAGHVYVYDWTGTTWAVMGTYISGSNFDASGSALDIDQDGNTIVIGYAGYGSSNHAKVFEYNGTNWLQKGANISGQVSDASYGNRVSISYDGNTVAIGEKDFVSASVASGAVRIFEWNGTDWVQKGTDIIGVEEDEDFGYAVSLSADGTRVAIGAPGSTDSKGRLSVYEWNGADWSQLGANKFGNFSGEEFGEAVSISGDGNTVAWGSKYSTANGPYAGRTKVFDWTDGAGIQIGANINGEGQDDYSGESICLDHDGNTLVIGAAGNSDAGFSAGHARVYKLEGTSWILPYNDIDGTISSQFGKAVATNAAGNRIATGAPLNVGLAKVYELCTISETIATENACGSFTWIDGNTYTQNTTEPTVILTNITGCDSIISLHLTIANDSSSEIDELACDSYTAPDGSTYTQSGTYTATIPNNAGCDSLITIHLNINTVDVGVTVSGNTIAAIADGASYQWINCNGMTEINGEQDQSYTPESSGSYAVEVTQNGCTGISSCTTITIIGVDEFISSIPVQAYPNPTTGVLNLTFDQIQQKVRVTVINHIGQVVATNSLITTDKIQITLPEESGLYVIKLQNDFGMQSLITVLKQ